MEQVADGSDGYEGSSSLPSPELYIIVNALMLALALLVLPTIAHPSDKRSCGHF